MSKSPTHESATPWQEGKSYSYQRPRQESQSNASSITDQKQKVVSAFEDFMDAIAARAGSRDQGGTGGTGGTGATDTGATGGTGGAGGYAKTGTGASGTGTGAGTGAAAGGPSAGSGGQKPYVGTGAEKATEAAKLEAARQLEAKSIYADREAYRLDRLRESSRKAKSEEASTAPAISGVQIIGSRNKHQSDSNRAPLSDAREFAPAFGSHGKSASPTMEKMSVPPSKRPETVPAAGIVRSARPIDAYWGSFGTAIERAEARANLETTRLESIIGPDDRVRVTNNQNQLYPWRCIASLIITAKTGELFIGTGWLVSPRLLLTAGHCVYMADQEGWATQIEVIPGRDADLRPFGSAISRDFRAPTGWTQDRDSDYDYGAIILPPDKRYGEQLGWFGYANRPDDYLRDITINLAGYPGDGGKAPNQVRGTQWFHSNTVKEVLAKQITYENDTYGGQSGAPVWEITSNGSRYGVAVHTWGTSINNGGTRITGEVFDSIVSWAGQAP